MTRRLSLHEKISIKGELAKKGVLPQVLVELTMSDAIGFYWACYGKPLCEFNSPRNWRPRNRKAPGGASL